MMENAESKTIVPMPLLVGLLDLGSIPNTTFSATVSVGISLKC